MNKHLLTVDDVTNDDLLEVFRKADTYRDFTNMKVRPPTTKDYSGTIMCPLFLEPSTRTRHSFESAMLRMGGKCLSSPTPEMMSVAKGESMSDTLKAESYYCQLMVVRSTQRVEDWFDFDKGYITTPIINAGDGPYNHPTQAILDAYTIWRMYGHEDGMSPFAKRNLTHLVIGDVGNSRTIRSYVQLMSRAKHHHFYVYDSTGNGLEVPFIDENKVQLTYICKWEIDKIAEQADVIYLNRVQKERWPRTGTGWHGIETPFKIDEKMLNSLKVGCLLLNPGPRQEEIPMHLTNWNPIKMWDQVKNGLYARMAIISKMLGDTLPDL